MFKSIPSFLAIVMFSIFISVCMSSCQHLAPHRQDANTAINTPATLESEQTTEQLPVSTPKSPTYTDVWERIRAGYALPTLSEQQTKAQLDWYLSYRKYFIAQIPQSQPYLYYVVTELQKNNIPLEIALLPFIESAYNPSAKSPGKASNVGMWQIAPVTGKTFGLRQNNWYDERKDVIASTDAAIRLLIKMHALFGNDWLLTIAAYNAGNGTVQRAIDSNKRAHKPTDFWSLPLPKSTQHYVKKLSAFAKIILQPQDYGFVLPTIPDEPYFTTMPLGSQINLAQLAKKSDMDAQELKKINAGLNGWLTDPTASHLLLVPIAKAEAVRIQLAALPPATPQDIQLAALSLAPPKTQADASPLVTYKVIKGDVLSRIAKQHGVSMQSIVNDNNLKNNLIKIGQVLHINQAK
jgi:membrane-bound lytic murein transglycosylase D